MNLPPVIKTRYLDANGAPLVGGKLYTYQSGTVTPQATYTDATGATPNANPVILDARGEASVWLDPSLTYKFVLQDSSSVVQWTVDSVVGLLSSNAVNTSSIQDGAVTSSKLATGAVTSTALASDASIDANRPISTNNIKDAVVTRAKLASAAFQAITTQKFTTTGAGTYNPTYIFFITAGSATAAATYTNNGQTFTVVSTISSATVLQATGGGTPSTSGTLTKATGTGDSTLTFSSVLAPLFIKVRMLGAGGGGGAVGANSGTAGGNSSFNSIVATGGGLGGTQGVAPGNGGSAGTGTALLRIAGQRGGLGSNSTSPSGQGGATALSPGADMAVQNQTGPSGATNGGAGGSGGNSGNACGSGGGGGEYVELVILSPVSTYAYTVGAKGTGGAAGTQGGGNGADGLIMVEEHFQ